MTKGQQTTLELLAKRSGRTLEDVTELWEERAAIREYEAGWKRREAERQAIDDVAEEVMRLPLPERLGHQSGPGVQSGVHYDIRSRGMTNRVCKER